jgi:hypothetical protein
LFLGRFPESEEVITPRIGLDMPVLLKSFLLSDEFIQRQENWAMLLQIEKQITSLISMQTSLKKEFVNTPKR